MLGLASKGRLPFAAPLALLLAGCAGLRTDRAQDIAAGAGMTARQIEAGAFTLQLYERLRLPGGPLVVYLEGDGRAWLTPTRISDDPTPADPVALRLAAADSAGNVLYVARPCQYTGGVAARGCSRDYWSSERYGGAVLASIAAAIDQTKARTGSSAIELVGYSGGGVVAALLAARRDDVHRLVTVAANLDLGTWTTLQRLSPLPPSQDPVTFRDKLRAVPQIHMAGAADAVVPPAVLRSYAAALGPGAPVDVRIVPAFTHDCCWAHAWPRMVSELRGVPAP